MLDRLGAQSYGLLVAILALVGVIAEIACLCRPRDGRRAEHVKHHVRGAPTCPYGPGPRQGFQIT
jgi:hypothetical protein